MRIAEGASGGVQGCGVLRTAQQLTTFLVPENDPAVLDRGTGFLTGQKSGPNPLSLPSSVGEGLWIPGQEECGFPGMEGAPGSLASPRLDDIFAASPAKWK